MVVDRYDLIVRNGTVIDGTGATRRALDVGVRGDRIAKIGDLTGSQPMCVWMRVTG